MPGKSTPKPEPQQPRKRLITIPEKPPIPLPLRNAKVIQLDAARQSRETPGT